jgi:hypothetical protein
MTELRIETDEAGGLSFSPPVRFLSNAVQTDWENLVAKFLSICFADKQLWIVTEEGKASRWWYLDKTFFECEISVNNELHLCAFTEHLSSQDFRQIVGTSDFRWDGILFIPAESNNVGRLTKITENLNDFEFLTSSGDGCGITWNLPHLPQETIFKTLNTIAESDNFVCVMT